MKKAIIVGASSGIGKALALFLADHGYKVGITGRRNELLVELQQQKPDQFIAKSFDVKDVHNIAGQLETLEDHRPAPEMYAAFSVRSDVNTPSVFVQFCSFSYNQGQ